MCLDGSAGSKMMKKKSAAKSVRISDSSCNEDALQEARTAAVDSGNATKKGKKSRGSHARVTPIDDVVAEDLCVDSAAPLKVMTSDPQLTVVTGVVDTTVRAWFQQACPALSDVQVGSLVQFSLYFLHHDCPHVSDPY